MPNIYVGTDKIKNVYVGTEKIKHIYVGTDLVYSSAYYLIEKGRKVVTWIGREGFYDSSDTSSNGANYAPTESTGSDSVGSYLQISQTSPAGKRGRGEFYSDVISTGDYSMLYIHMKVNKGYDSSQPERLMYGLYSTSSTIPTYFKDNFISGKCTELNTLESDREITVSYDISSYSSIRVAFALRGVNASACRFKIYDVWME